MNYPSFLQPVSLQIHTCGVEVCQTGSLRERWQIYAATTATASLISCIRSFEYKESDDEREEREQQEFEEALEQVPVKFRHIVRKSGQMPGDPIEQEEDTETPPPPYLLAISIIVTIFCPLAMVAIYYSFQASRAWQESKRSGSKSSNKLYTDEERANYRKLAHDYARSAKMWIGISFFLGIIMYAFFAHKS